MDYFMSTTQSNEAFVLFHGTGGNEFSLLFLTGELNPQANIISFIGSVSTGVNRRFFAPLVNGKLEQVDYDKQVNQFLEQWQELAISYDKVTFIGYSNGANLIQGIVAKNPDIADEIILMHPQQFEMTFKKSNRVKRILLTTGANDSLVIPGSIVALKESLKVVSADVSLIITDGGHGVDDEEVTGIKDWYQKNRYR